jgi:hypothetical protein
VVLELAVDRAEPRVASFSCVARCEGMAQVRYEIVPVPGGWSVRCNGNAGPAYSTQANAVLDTLAIAEQLQKAGDKVQVRLRDTDQGGLWRTLEPRDARLFRR